ncbi:MAG: sulfatase-like hydrolase/transferase [Oligoflexia bacterium]|nr:sulfatase-like hydrolase/transferase [Oligoflexia bacterium]
MKKILNILRNFKVPPLLVPMIQVLLFFIVYMWIWRAFLAFYFYKSGMSSGVSAKDFAFAFYLGTKFDLRLLLVAFSPGLPFLLFVKSLRLQAWFRKIFINYLLLLISVLTLFYVVDFAHYSYLRSRLSSSVVEFLQNPLISLQMVWESYPVIKILFFLAFGILFFRWLFFKYFFVARTTVGPIGAMNRRKILLWPHQWPLMWALIILLWALGIYGKLGFYPLRWSEAFFSPNQYISALGLNPVLYLLDTWRYRVADFDEKKVTLYYPVVSKYLGLGSGTGIGTGNASGSSLKLNFLRQLDYSKKGNDVGIAEGGGGPGPAPNIVIIVMESMVAYKSGLFDNPLDPTPYLDRLAQQSLFFNKFYVPCQATARSLFGLITGIPDVNKEDTGSRNPRIVNQNTLLAQLTGYKSYYFLGGSANWGQIRGLLNHNIPGIKIFEEGSYTSTRSDVWGISDYQLFIEANNILAGLASDARTEQRPFVAIIQSAGFHRPYTIPREHGDFKVTLPAEIDQKKLTQYGFISLEEYNSLRFQDYSLGTFFNIAKKEKYYDNTIFFILGDHGLPVNGALNVPAGERAHDLENFHVPFLIHGPKFYLPQKINIPVSEVDILPTIAGIVGRHHEGRGQSPRFYHRGFGSDIFSLDWRRDYSRPLFFYYWYMTPPTYAVLSDNFFLQANNQGNKQLFDLKSSNPQQNLSDKEMAKAQELGDLANGIYETSKYLLYHNSHYREGSL